MIVARRETNVARREIFISRRATFCNIRPCMGFDSKAKIRKNKRKSKQISNYLFGRTKVFMTKAGV